MRLLAFFALVVIATSSSSYSQTTKLLTSGNWETDANWDMGQPDAATAAEFTAVSQNVVVTSTTAAAKSLSMGTANTLTITSGNTLTLTESINTVSGSSSTINLAGTLTIGVNGAAEQTSNIVNSGGFGTSSSGTLNLRDNVKMTVTTSSSVGMANINNAGKLTLVTDAAAGEYQQRGAINNSGTLTRSTNRTWTMNSSSITNTGTFENVGSFVASGAGVNFSNSGLFVAKPGATTFSGVDFTNSGVFQVDSGASVSFIGGSFDGDAGTVSVLGSGTFGTGADLVLDGSILSGSGSITDNITLTGGSISPGDMAGDIAQLQLGGNVALSGTTTLTIDLGAGGASDLLRIGGSFDHGGALLDLSLAGDFTGTFGQTFIIASHASRVGSSEFANSTLTEGSYEFQVSYNATSTILTITAVPEPSSIAILGLASGIAFVRRRKS